ncbi:MAG TPA: molybdopterin-binding protein [Cyanobacteria bacterium UBA11149]|nr:molybdopterin-binding protein [Cyanobacteria bacterium UBA11367]HBE59604.1 molybdopterin-binding protein [Cyanobacteria bacterium UBA11366]HBK65142.1 molybdopterin-binding protein [Cyanobacteria bacterium UBA11166]HBR75443.1 molybdopterin-binding protein [Cyanobacteria bacterium UBA11159]HBS70015.1 molybdopterin-binding protein [Cyanobacteria bacterium UBA11153]HBW91992.1 molybdopterin-binding protein [Cyanobacteria bacterium UBA11149]HCA94124.1 molybdopterin-binding protein [Cyanobacteria
MVTVEILAIGNELLIGDVLDTNTHWIIKKITGIGGQVNRCVILPDNLDTIATEIQAVLARKTEVIVTIGGMGATVDDLTLAAIAQGINQPLTLNPEAMNLVTQKYQELAEKGYVDDPKMTPAREKMGILPRGSIPIPNPVGAAPAVISKVKETIIINLPGVPEELKGIFEESLLPILQEKFGNSFYLEKVVMVATKDESVIAPILNAVSQNNPQVYIKSRAKRFGIDTKLKVTLSGCSNFPEEVLKRIDRAIVDLKQELDNAGISLEYIE